MFLFDRVTTLVDSVSNSGWAVPAGSEGLIRAVEDFGFRVEVVWDAPGAPGGIEYDLVDLRREEVKTLPKYFNPVLGFRGDDPPSPRLKCRG